MHLKASKCTIGVLYINRSFGRRSMLVLLFACLQKFSALEKNNWVIFEIWWKLCIHRFRAVPARTIILMGLNYGFINAVHHTLDTKRACCIVRDDQLLVKWINVGFYSPSML